MPTTPSSTTPDLVAPAYDAVCDRAVRCTVSQLIGRYGYREQDAEDLHHDLTVRLVERIGDFDPHRASWRTFVERCTAKAAASLLRHRRAKCRNPERAVGMDPRRRSPPASGHQPDPNPDDGPAEVRPDVTVDKQAEGQIERIDLSLDIREVMGRLTPFQRDLCRCLMLHDRVAAPAILGVKRWRVWREIPRIRSIFRQCGLDLVH